MALRNLELHARNDDDDDAGTDDSTVSSLIGDRWLVLGLEMLSHCLNH